MHSRLHGPDFRSPDKRGVRRRRLPTLQNLRNGLAALLLAIASIFLPCTAFAAQAPAFTTEGPLTSDAGYFTVEWQADTPVTLEMARSKDFASPETVYQGANKALFLSGFADGEYLLRLRGADGAMSEVLTLTVRHQSLQRALLLVGLGAIVFLAVIVVIFRGARDD